mgnify:FL=1
MGQLTLLLFMLGVLADHHDAAFTLDDLALFTNGLYGRPYFHCIFLLLVLGAPRYAAACQIVRGQLHCHLISRQYANEVHSKLTGNVRQYFMAVYQLHLEHGVGERISNDAFNFDYVRLRQAIPPWIRFCPYSLSCSGSFLWLRPQASHLPEAL